MKGISGIPSLIIRGSDLRAMRLLTNKSATEMATTAGLKSRKSYENWESDIGCPTVNQFFALARSCGFTASEIVNVMISEDKEKAILLHLKFTSTR